MTVHRLRQPLIWKRHALGHTEIDTDHTTIANWWMKAAHGEAIALPFHVAALRKAMRTHFSREAALVEAAGTTFCDCHRREHDAMLELCDNAYELSGRNARGARRLLRNELPRLVRGHIDSMDQIAVLIIRAAIQDRAIVVPRR